MEIKKHCEEIHIFSHFTNYKGRLFIKTLCDLFRDVAEHHADELGIGVEALNDNALTWMLHRLHIVLHKMPQREETVTLETWPSGTNKLFAERDYQVVRDNETIVTASSDWMVIDLNRRRPIRLPDEILYLYSLCNVPHIEIKNSILDTKKVPENMTNKRAFSATFDNIDFNGHVTQASYMRWITNSLTFDFLRNHLLTEVEVVYEHEIMPDSQIISCYEFGTQNEDTIEVLHRIVSEDGSLTHCVAKSIWKEHLEKQHA